MSVDEYFAVTLHTALPLGQNRIEYMVRHIQAYKHTHTHTTQTHTHTYVRKHAPLLHQNNRAYGKMKAKLEVHTQRREHSFPVEVRGLILAHFAATQGSIP